MHANTAVVTLVLVICRVASGGAQLPADAFVEYTDTDPRMFEDDDFPVDAPPYDEDGVDLFNPCLIWDSAGSYETHRYRECPSCPFSLNAEQYTNMARVIRMTDWYQGGRCFPDSELNLAKWYSRKYGQPYEWQNPPLLPLKDPQHSWIVLSPLMELYTEELAKHWSDKPYFVCDENERNRIRVTEDAFADFPAELLAPKGKVCATGGDMDPCAVWTCDGHSPLCRTKEYVPRGTECIPNNASRVHDEDLCELDLVHEELYSDIDHEYVHLRQFLKAAAFSGAYTDRTDRWLRWMYEHLMLPCSEPNGGQCDGAGRCVPERMQVMPVGAVCRQGGNCMPELRCSERGCCERAPDTPPRCAERPGHVATCEFVQENDTGEVVDECRYVETLP